MKWRRTRTGRKEAAVRLNDLEKRQEKVSEVATRFSQENGFIRMVRESMGGAQ